MLVECVLINQYHYFTTTYNIRERIVYDKAKYCRSVGAGYAGVSAH